MISLYSHDNRLREFVVKFTINVAPRNFNRSDDFSNELSVKRSRNLTLWGPYTLTSI